MPPTKGAGAKGCAPSGWAFVVPMELSATFKPIDDGSVAIL
jgi:hypothetical protein